ncbi:MAG: 3-phosphoserine/phosphohydroxythreonine transaminase [Myxococcales bacterium]|jgi:phosphoserine aminotransferase
MVTRHVNFSAGPSTLPLPALERAQAEFLDYADSGMSIIEHSHRGKVYEQVHDECLGLIRELLAVPDNYDILLMQGGASAQFALIPMNLRTDARAGDYIITGTWAKKALAEAKVVSQPRIAWDSPEGDTYTRVPKQDELDLTKDAPYVHMCSNNTIMGTQFFDYPDTGGVPLICDMSSDIMWRPTDVSKFGMIYAGAQKNMGPSGITILIIRKDLIERARTDIPKIFRYGEVAKANSLQNTIATFPVYMVRNVLDWVKEQGGLPAMEKHNRSKAEMLYGAIAGSDGFYKCPVSEESRSVMNPVFRTPSEDLDKKFVADAADKGLLGLKGHRSVGGIRASMYNAMSQEGVERLVDFMHDFAKRG